MRVQAITLLFTTLLVSSSAAPAFIWKNDRDESSPTKYSSEPVHASTMISSALSSNPDSSFDVFFLVGRKSDGSEGLSHLASSGALPSVASKYGSVDTVYHNVDYLSSPALVVSMYEEALGGPESDSGAVLEVDLIEMNRRVSGKPPRALPEKPTAQQLKRHERNKAIEKARALVVKVAHKDSSALDSAVSNAIESSVVKNVVVAGHRSTTEVRMEREMKNSRKIKNTAVVGHRRLEDQQADDVANDDNNNNEDFSGVYYVNMTPNIFSGILFTIMFIVTSTIGFNCLNAIEGQDYYVTKYPSIGREA